MAFGRELWEWKYQPREFSDLILNKDIKSQLRRALDERPNMFLYGPAGVGKGSYINVLKKHNDLKDYTMTINCSRDGNIDTIRGKVTEFVSSYSDKLKLVFLNEIDDPHFLMSQKALRQLIEDTHKHTQWILACNYHQSVLPELKSRCENYHLTNPPAEEIYKKCVYILKCENVEYKPITLVNLIKSSHPDIRSTLITLRQNVIDGKLREEILYSVHDVIYKQVLTAMKGHDPDAVRKVLRSNMVNYVSLYGWLYDILMSSEDTVFNDDAEAIVLIAEHLHRNETSSIKELNYMQMYFKMLKSKVV